jgi:poly(A) polymerase
MTELDGTAMEPCFATLLVNEYVRLAACLAESSATDCHLVGGAVRDALMGRPVNDFDFTLTSCEERLPREFAARIGGKFFWLDAGRRQSRVVAGKVEGAVSFDFAPLQGINITEDLLCRDFTINAIAISLTGGAGRVTDPLLGMRDIRNRVVRACADTAFVHDPLRLLRAVRFAATLGFSIEPQTRAGIIRHADLLEVVAGERITDEFIAILSTPNALPHLELLGESEIPRRLIPCGEAGLYLSLFARLEKILRDTGGLFPLHAAGYLLREVEGGVSIVALLKLATLLSSGEVSAAGADCGRLKLGTKARLRLMRLAASPAAITGLQSGDLSDRRLFRLFRDLEPAGPELVLIPLAAGLLERERAEHLISWYFSRYRSSDADLLLSGDEIMKLTGIGQGRELGRLMERLREAESLGHVATAAEARAFVRKTVDNQAADGIKN